MTRLRSVRAFAAAHPQKARPCIVCACVCIVAALSWAAIHCELVIPSWVVWQEQSLARDLDADGTSERVVLKDRTVTVSSIEGQVLYASDRAWRVSDVLVDDVNADGLPELVMLVWRRGNYGSSRPFWETGPDLRMTQHLYVMGLREGQMRPVWMSHELGHGLEVMQMCAEDDCRLVLTDTQDRTSTWEWDYFGFTLVDEG